LEHLSLPLYRNHSKKTSCVTQLVTQPSNSSKYKEKKKEKVMFADHIFIYKKTGIWQKPYFSDFFNRRKPVWIPPRP